MALSEAAKKIAGDLGKSATSLVTIERRLAAAKQLGIADDIAFWTLALRAAETVCVRVRELTPVKRFEDDAMDEATERGNPDNRAKIERVEWIDGVEEGDTPPPGHWASTTPPQPHPDSVFITKRR